MIVQNHAATTLTPTAAGWDHTVARLSDGSVVAWGWNAYGQCDVPALPGGLSCVEVAAGYQGSLARYQIGLVSIRYCAPAVQNSTGQAGIIGATGSNEVTANDVTLVASQLPQSSFGFFLTSRDQGSVFPVSNSQGRLCLGGSIGRYVGPGQVKNSGSTGSFSLVLDLTAMAHPSSPIAAQPGQTWYFQAWNRDANPTSTSNFTDGVSVTFH